MPGGASPSVTTATRDATPLVRSCSASGASDCADPSSPAPPAYGDDGPATMTLATDFEKHKADVANVIPPQKAARIAEMAGAADRTGWCPIDPATFESKLQPNVHVVGDASIAGIVSGQAAGLAGAATAPTFQPVT